MDLPTRECIRDKMLRAFTYITSNVERPDIYRDTGIKWIKLASQKWRTLFMQQAVFGAEFKLRGHCIRYRNIYSRFPFLRVDVSAKPGSDGRFQIIIIKTKYMPFRKKRSRAVVGARIILS